MKIKKYTLVTMITGLTSIVLLCNFTQLKPMQQPPPGTIYTVIGDSNFNEWQRSIDRTTPDAWLRSIQRIGPAAFSLLNADHQIAFIEELITFELAKIHILITEKITVLIRNDIRLGRVKGKEPIQQLMEPYQDLLTTQLEEHKQRFIPHIAEYLKRDPGEIALQVGQRQRHNSDLQIIQGWVSNRLSAQQEI